MDDQGGYRVDSFSLPLRSNQNASITAIEFMTFHHEVLAAFCKYSVELNYNTLIVSPSGGINKAIRRFAAGSFEQLKELARLNHAEFNILVSDDSQAIEPHFRAADALFIGTIPPPSKHTQARRPNSRQSRYEQMLLTIREALKCSKLVYIVMHKPQEDAARLIGSLKQNECAKISAIYLSKETAEFSRKAFPNRFRSELIMPAIGLYTLSGENLKAASIDGITMVVAGEISSKRRNYKSLAKLNNHREWLRSQKVLIKVVGRIKLESWYEKVFRLFALPASWLFILKYPNLSSLWIGGSLDLSLTKYSKVSDQCLANSIINSSCLLDLKRQHYSSCGQTTGAVGLAMTYEKPLIALETIAAIIPSDEHTTSRQSLQAHIEEETQELITQKNILVGLFRQQLKEEIGEQYQLRTR
jgi:hypothetical protein